MTEPALPPLAYAVVDEGDRCRRRVRRSIAWAACVLGGVAVAGDAWTALGMAGILSTGNPDYFDGWDALYVFRRVAVVPCSIMLLGGGIAFALERWWALWIIRAAALLQMLIFATPMVYSIVVHSGLATRGPPLLRWQDVVSEALDGLLATLGAPAVLLLFTWTIRANDRPDLRGQ